MSKRSASTAVHLRGAQSAGHLALIEHVVAAGEPVEPPPAEAIAVGPPIGASDGNRIGDPEWGDMRIRVYGESAVAVGTQTQKSTYQGRDASGRFRVTQVSVRQGARWLLVGMHLSPIAQPPGT